MSFTTNKASILSWICSIVILLQASPLLFSMSERGGRRTEKEGLHTLVRFDAHQGVAFQLASFVQSISEQLD